MPRRLPRDIRYEHYHRRCLGCDYELAGLPDECSCPECGIGVVHRLRSAKVWWLEPPGVVIVVAQAPVALMFGAAFLGSLLVAPSACMTSFLAVMAAGAAYGTFDSLRKLRLRSQQRTDATLHWWPGGFGLRHGRSLWWHEWSDVRAVRASRPPLSRYWTIRVKSRRRWWLLGRSRTLIKAVALLNRREAALIRNEMRRLHRPARTGRN